MQIRKSQQKLTAAPTEYPRVKNDDFKIDNDASQVIESVT